jgi:magnesium-transporting ATPase (P-type)
MLYPSFLKSENSASIFIIFTAVLLLLLFREFSLQSRIINRAATNVLAIYVLDQVIRSLLGRYLDLNAFSGQWYLFFVVCGYVLLVMLLAAVCNELRKLTIGRIEPWLAGIIAAGLRCAPYSYGSADCSLVYFDGLIRTTNYFCFNMRFL